MREELLRILLEQNVLSEDQVEEVLGALPDSLVALEKDLIKRKWASQKDIRSAKEQIFDVPFKDVSNLEIPTETLKLIPENTALRYQFIPIEKRDGELDVGMVNPSDVQAREALKFITVQDKLTPNIFFVSAEDFKKAARQYRSLDKEVSQALQELESELEQEKDEQDKIGLDSSDEVEELGADAPITKVVAVIVRHAVEGGASDIHIEPLEDQTRVRFRVDGVLHSSIFLPQKIHSSIVARIKILSNLKIDENRVPQDGRFETTTEGKKIDFRVSTLPTSHGEKVVMRILDPSGAVNNFAELGLQARNLEIYKKAIKEPFGLVLITGPTGSGKSTTLYTTLNSINSEGVNMTTLEDPVEYYIEGVNQSQIRPEIEFSFASGLRSILRQDPDIIMVGEIRDKDTATLSTHAALTGHLVFSTLHTNNAIGIVPRLINMGIDSYLLPPTLAAGVAQRLVRRLCNECKKPVDPPAKTQELIQETVGQMKPEEVAKYEIKEPYKVWKAEGCPACGGTGTKGRIAIFEVFEMTPELEEIVLERVSDTKLEEALARQGMITMRQDGIMKVIQGQVALEEVLRVVDN